MQFFSFRVILKRLKAIRFFMADKTVSKWKKAIIIAGIAYLFLPIDIIPPMIFPLGFIDDIVLWGVILWYLSSELDKYWVGGKTKDLSKKYKSRNVVDDVEFDVTRDSEVKGEADVKAEPEAAEEAEEVNL